MNASGCESQTGPIVAEKAEMNKAPLPDDARAGRGPLEEGISVLLGGEDVNGPAGGYFF